MASVHIRAWKWYTTVTELAAISANKSLRKRLSCCFVNYFLRSPTGTAITCRIQYTACLTDSRRRVAGYFLTNHRHTALWHWFLAVFRFRAITAAIRAIHHHQFPSFNEINYKIYKFCYALLFLPRWPWPDDESCSVQDNHFAVDLFSVSRRFWYAYAVDQLRAGFWILTGRSS